VLVLENPFLPTTSLTLNFLTRTLHVALLAAR
jgi:hypothetical protein